MATTLLSKPTGFEGFGPSLLARQMRGRLRGMQFERQRLDARHSIRQQCPLVPGVYGWLDKNRQLTYVGKSKCLRKRLLSYFAKSSADGKAERIRQHSQFIVWEPISHELLALIREQELIHRWRPQFNSMGQPTRMQPAYLCLGGKPALNARMARRLGGKFTHAFGPISGTKRLRQAIVSLNQVFRLRDCADKTRFEFLGQQLLFDNPSTAQCIRYELGTCPGPCAAKCSSESYAINVDQALRFLTGNDTSVLDQIEYKMLEAASQSAFETAAICRDHLADLKWLDRRLQSLRMADKNLNGVLEIPARRNRTAWMLLRSGKICATLMRPSTADKAISAEKRINQIFRQQDTASTELLEMSLQLINISWFKKYPATKQQMLCVESALKHCHQHTEVGS